MTNLDEIRQRLAYRFGADSAPSNINEKVRRDSFINEGYRKVIGSGYWWFTHKTEALATQSGRRSYPLPSDYRDIDEVKLNRRLLTFSGEDFVPSNRFTVDNNSITILTGGVDTPISLASTISQTDGLATLMTSDPHDLKLGDIVKVSGANEGAYNGSHEVLVIPTDSSINFTVDSSTTSPATGTIVTTWQNLVIDYWYYPPALVLPSDEVVIPDQFTDILTAYAFGRLSYVDDMRGNSADAFEEYNQILKDMRIENNKKLWWNKNGG